jgi:cell division septation protein DedD
VSKSKLKNLPDIVSEGVNGFIRYSSGKYCTPEAASAAKNNAVSKGITDAFVTAYYNGKRITVAEAKALEGTGVSPCQGGVTPTTTTTEPATSGSQTPTTTQPSTSGTQTPTITTTQPSTSGTQTPATTTTTEPTTTGTQTPTTQNPEPGTQNPQPTTTLSTKPPVPETGLVFSVQIGAFREEVPVEIANQFLQLASKGVKNYLDTQSGLTVYQLGVCLSKEEAEALRSDAVAVGITDAFIVAFKDGKKISMEEAMELLGQ